MYINCCFARVTPERTNAPTERGARLVWATNSVRARVTRSTRATERERRRGTWTIRKYSTRRRPTRDDATRKPSTGRRDADETDGEGWVKRARKSVRREANEKRAEGDRGRRTTITTTNEGRKHPSRIGRTSGRRNRGRGNAARRAFSPTPASPLTPFVPPATRSRQQRRTPVFRATSSTSFRRVGDARAVRRNYFHRSARSRDRARVASSVARSVGVEDDGTGGRSAPKVDRREGRHE